MIHSYGIRKYSSQHQVSSFEMFHTYTHKSGETFKHILQRAHQNL